MVIQFKLVLGMKIAKATDAQIQDDVQWYCSSPIIFPFVPVRPLRGRIGPRSDPQNRILHPRNPRYQPQFDALGQENEAFEAFNGNFSRDRHSMWCVAIDPKVELEELEDAMVNDPLALGSQVDAFEVVVDTITVAITQAPEVAHVSRILNLVGASSGNVTVVP